ncbi:MAG: hypothetical protein MJ071_06770 [Oscillospiraceae bacterium]|nr:hypothetical protein [Oscillospiraceae bacterium]
MIIRSKERAFSSEKKKNVPVWVLDTDNCIVKHFDAETQTETEKQYSSDHIRYHLHFSAEYHKDRLKKLVTNGEIETYLDEFEIKVADAINAQVEKSLECDEEYQTALAVGDLQKANGLANMVRLCVRDVVFESMVYV